MRLPIAARLCTPATSAEMRCDRDTRRPGVPRARRSCPDGAVLVRLAPQRGVDAVSVMPNPREEPPRWADVKPGDILTLTAPIKRVMCQGRLAIVSTIGGMVAVPLTVDGQFPDPAVQIAAPDCEQRQLCDHGLWRPCPDCGDQT